MIAAGAYEGTRDLLALPPTAIARVLDEMSAGDTKTAYYALRHDWPLWRRDKQRLPEGAGISWRYCLWSCGRSFGKTRSSMEILRELAESGEHEFVAVAAATDKTLKRDLLDGPAGIMAISPPWFSPVLHSVRAELRWPKHPVTGVKMRAVLLSGEEPDRFRGTEVSACLLDELATWASPQECWDNIDLALRHGSNPFGVITTTLKRRGAGRVFSKDLLYGKRGDDGRRRQRDDMIVIQGSTFENVDIAASVRDHWVKRYKGTTDEVTELEGGLPKEADGALWTLETINQFRVENIPSGVTIDRVLVSVDPSRSKTGTGDMCGIVTLARGSDGHAYIFADDTTRGAPDEWILDANATYERQRADGGIYEQNRLGEDNVALLQEHARAMEQSWSPVTARGTKRQRAEPIATLYKAGRVHHVGEHVELEEELVGWDPNESTESPNRIDAMVHGIKELLLSEKATRAPLVVL